MKRGPGLLIGLLITAMMSVSSVSAQEGKVGLAISPPTIELSAKPGERLKQSIRVDNVTDQSSAVIVERRNFTALGEEGQAVLTPEATPYSMMSWIKVVPDKVTIPGRESHVFEFTIDVPANAEPGGHFGSIVFKMAAPPEKTSGGVAVGQEVGSLLLLKVAGQAQEKAEIASFKTPQDLWEYGPIVFETRLKNKGNVHLKPAVTITITDMFGRKVDTLTVDSRTILPGSIRKLDSHWGRQALFGRYTATLSVTYGDGNQVITSTTGFTVIPYRAIGIGVIVTAIIGFLLYRGRRRLGRTLKVLFGKDK